MGMILYDLAGADASLRFSPFCWRIKMALHHKLLDADMRPWRFHQKDKLAFSGQDRVPVLIDGDAVVSDSWNIALHLEHAYPDSPSLFGGEGAIPVTRFLNMWADRTIMPLLAPMILADIHAVLADEDKSYFRASREKMFKASLEELRNRRETQLPAFRRALDPVRSLLRMQSFIGGNTPRYADYILFGVLQWSRCVSDLELLGDDDSLRIWFDAVLDLFDGVARQALACRSSGIAVSA